MPKKAPRTVFKSLLRKNPGMRVGTNADLMVQLNLLLVLRQLAVESRARAFEEKSATIKAHHVRAVIKKLLKRVRG